LGLSDPDLIASNQIVDLKKKYSELVSQEKKFIHCLEAPPMLSNDFIDMWVVDGVFVGRYKEVIISEKVARSVWEDREKLCNSVAYPTVWDCRLVKYWTADGRKFQSTDLNYRLMKAGSVIFDYSYPAIVIINFFVKIYRPPIPTKFFTDPDAAFNWIRQFN
jgi:hypothetical protein